MKQHILAIDLGTTNIKGIIYDLEGKLVSQASHSVETNTPTSDKSEQDPEEILGHVISIIQNAITQNDDSRIVGITFSTAVQSFIAVDNDGKPLTQNIIWSDRRSEKYSALLAEDVLGKRFFELTGNPIYPSLTGCKFQWFKENEKSDYKRLFKIASIKEYVLFKLTGQWAIDYSTASATGLMDIHELKWSPEVLSYFEIDEHLLSPLVDVTHSIPLKNRLALPLELEYEIPLILGASDGCLANLGVGAIVTGKAALTIGTSGAVRIASPKPYIDSQQRLFCYYLFKDVYIVGGAANTGASTYHWFLETFEKQNSASAISQGISEIQKTIRLPIFLPYLQGERAPIWDANAKGMFYGITADNDIQDFRLAVLQGILYAMSDIAETITESGMPIVDFFANGGFLKSEIVAQKLADVTNKNVVKSVEQASAFGAFLIGLLSLNIISDIEEIQGFIPKGEVFSPNTENVKIHDTNFKNFLKMQKMVLDIDI